MGLGSGTEICISLVQCLVKTHNNHGWTHCSETWPQFNLDETGSNDWRPQRHTAEARCNECLSKGCGTGTWTDKVQPKFGIAWTWICWPWPDVYIWTTRTETTENWYADSEGKHVWFTQILVEHNRYGHITLNWSLQQSNNVNFIFTEIV